MRGQTTPPGATPRPVPINPEALAGAVPLLGGDGAGRPAGGELGPGDGEGAEGFFLLRTRPQTPPGCIRGAQRRGLLVNETPNPTPLQPGWSVGRPLFLFLFLSLLVLLAFHLGLPDLARPRTRSLGVVGWERRVPRESCTQAFRVVVVGGMWGAGGAHSPLPPPPSRWSCCYCCCCWSRSCRGRDHDRDRGRGRGRGLGLAGGRETGEPGAFQLHPLG